MPGLDAADAHDRLVQLGVLERADDLLVGLRRRRLELWASMTTPVSSFSALMVGWSARAPPGWAWRRACRRPWGGGLEQLRVLLVLRLEQLGGIGDGGRLHQPGVDRGLVDGHGQLLHRRRRPQDGDVAAAPAVDDVAPAVVPAAPVVAAPAVVAGRAAVVPESFLSLPQAAMTAPASISAADLVELFAVHADARRGPARSGVQPFGRSRTAGTRASSQLGERWLVIDSRVARLAPDLVLVDVHGRPFVVSSGRCGAIGQLIGYLVGSIAASAGLERRHEVASPACRGRCRARRRAATRPAGSTPSAAAPPAR